ncbi:hypothetical protein [Kitasatospora brasiliensis]|uniref:hypothetical protein n=1 Tax=Kitasatospora brasiliensis TaxID=3058040 RepID=UPI00292D76F5|nr:hypothetical protein [Kitasatospora sp. K002]
MASPHRQEVGVLDSTVTVIDKGAVRAHSYTARTTAWTCPGRQPGRVPDDSLDVTTQRR